MPTDLIELPKRRGRKPIQTVTFIADTPPVETAASDGWLIKFARDFGRARHERLQGAVQVTISVGVSNAVRDLEGIARPILEALVLLGLVEPGHNLSRVVLEWSAAVAEGHAKIEIRSFVNAKQRARISAAARERCAARASRRHAAIQAVEGV